jgi:hypothetical protein
MVVTAEWPVNVSMPVGRVFLSVRGVEGVDLQLPGGAAVRHIDIHHSLGS